MNERYSILSSLRSQNWDAGKPSTHRVPLPSLHMTPSNSWAQDSDMKHS